jgi:anthranilate synthase/aminodeoxychorismate synthase-like glutamine amidotransferase
MILLIDNYDSFVHNLARYFERLGQETLVVRNDATTPQEIGRLRPQAIVISPGPYTPAEAGCSVEVIRELGAETPILGVCLGHQAIGAALGTTIVRAPEPRHGRTSQVTHDGSALFAGLPSPFRVCRYHSLIVDEATLPAELFVTARADDGCIMALEHARWPVFAVQFHPEAALTEYGYQLLANFLAAAGCPAQGDLAALAASELPGEPSAPAISLNQPVTF